VLADSIRNTPKPDVPARRQMVPRNEAEWVAVVEKLNEANRASAVVLADELAVTVGAKRMGGIGTYRVTPPEIDPRHRDHLFVYIHGGAYVLNAGEAGLRQGLPNRSKPDPS